MDIFVLWFKLNSLHKRNVASTLNPEITLTLYFHSLEWQSGSSCFWRYLSPRWWVNCCELQLFTDVLNWAIMMASLCVMYISDYRRFLESYLDSKVTYPIPAPGILTPRYTYSQSAFPLSIPTSGIPAPFGILTPPPRIPTPLSEGTWDHRYLTPWADVYLWKHYLPATPLAGGNYRSEGTALVRFHCSQCWHLTESWGPKPSKMNTRMHSSRGVCLLGGVSACWGVSAYQEVSACRGH